MATTRSFTVISILFIYFCAFVKCNIDEIDIINRRLDELLVDVNDFEFSDLPQLNNELFSFYNWKFEDKNREELIVTNVSSHIDPLLFETADNLEFFSDGINFYLIGSIQYTIFINIMDDKKTRVVNQYLITSAEKILTLKIFSPLTKISFDSPVIIVVAFDVIYGSELRWYKFSNNKWYQFWSWSIEHQVKKLEYFQYNMENRLVIMSHVIHNDFQIGIYAFEISQTLSEPRLLQWFPVSEITNFKLCPLYVGILMLFQIREYVFIYNYHSVTFGYERFELIQEIGLVELKNIICFHSGHIIYLVTIGSDLSVFEYIDDQFHIHIKSTNLLRSVGEIYWIESIPLDTYREEVILLVQLKNLSIFILSWQPHGFEKISWSLSSLNLIDLSKIIIIPKVGFIYENKIMGIETRLQELLPPNHEEMKQIVDTYKKLMEIFQKQELIVNETERIIQENYSKNQIVNGTWDIFELKAVATDNHVKMNEDVECKTVQIGAINLTCPEFNLNHDEITSSLERINAKLNEINLNMNNAIPINTSDISSFNNIEVIGDLKITGMITLENLTFNIINNISINDIYEDLNYYNSVIEGEKFFPSMDVKELKLHSINGIPVNKIVFDTELINYEGINFSDITKLEVLGNLKFSYINNINWESLMKNVISKSRAEIIPHGLIVQGTINAHFADIKYLNNLKYPEEYIEKTTRDSILLQADKIFEKLYVKRLNVVKTINKIPIKDFILLNGDTTLNKEIIFHKLTVTKLLEINGKVKNHEGEIINKPTVNEAIYGIENTNVDIFFTRLLVRGNIQVRKTINRKKWSDFDDLLMKNDDLVVINGKKTFLGCVKIHSGLKITSQKINGHLQNEFMTFDTYQELSNLNEFNANVTIGQIIESDVIQLERILFENQFQQSNMCMNKKFIFKVPPIVDKISAEFINGNIPNYIFAMKLNESFSNVAIKNIKVKNLYVNELNPQMINGFIYQKLYKEYIRYGFKNNNKNREINLQGCMSDLYNRIANGSVSIRNLTVIGPIQTKILNGITLSNIYNISNMPSIIFEKDVHIENLIVDGLINGVNFSEVVADTVLKTDKNVIITGNKKFDRIICDTFNFSTWNNRSVDDILDLSKHQILTGPIIVKGDVTVEKYFDPKRKINGIYFQDIEKNVNYLKNNTFIINKDFHFITNDIVNINNLFITDNIQNINFNDFIASVVFLNSDNVTITGTKIFENSLSLHNLIITKKFNDIDLEKYFRNVIRIDQFASIKSKIIFQNDIIINGDLIIEKNISTKTIMGINFDELFSNVMYTNEPTTVSGTVKFINLTILSDIEVEKINKIDMRNLITLNGDQNIITTLHCPRIAVGKLIVMGKLNGYDWSDIFDNSFSLTEDQNITGNIQFMSDVIVKDFDSKMINRIDPKDLILIDNNEIINGNFIFNSLVVVNGKLRIDGLFNNIDLSKWNNAVIKSDGSLDDVNNNPQIISNDWIVYGNVQFDGEINGNYYINDLNMREFNNQMYLRFLNVSHMNYQRKKELRKMCEDVKYLKKLVDRKTYKYKKFNYLQIMKFNQSIMSIHHFNYNNIDYLFVSLDNCQLYLFLFNIDNKKFIHASINENVGCINRWISFKFHRVIYVITLAKSMFNRNSGNLWKIVNNELKLIIDFGNATDVKKIGNNYFLINIDGIIHYYSLENIVNNSTISSNSWKFRNKHVKLLPITDKLLVIDNYSLYELKENERNISKFKNPFKTNKVSSFRVGIFKKEFFVYYDKKINKNYMFICNNNLSNNQIVQTIDVIRPVSIRVINFDNNIENFLIFIETGNKIQIYQYKGIEGFVYRETINIEAEKLYTFKLQIYPKVVKKNCIALINKNQLTILESKMYDEKFDINNISCNI